MKKNNLNRIKTNQKTKSEEALITKDIIKNKNIASIIVVLILFLAIPSGIWPYGYYTFLRWAVAGAALFMVWIAYRLERSFWFWLMIGIAILFNPVVPIHLSKEIWQIINFGVAVLFLITIFQIKTKT